MHQRIVKEILLLLCLFLCYNGVQGKRKLSKLEDMEFEKQLKLLNKPAVKIVKTKYGDTYDCVDFYKQRAFDHPLLKNHNFHPQMKPTLPMIKQSSYASTTNKLSTIWSKDGGCPDGTVPVKRITKNDLIRQRDMPPPEPANFDEFVGINNNSEQKANYSHGYWGGKFNPYKRAIVRTLDDSNAKFFGAGVATSLYNPQVEGKQHSASRIKIQKGSETLQVGWRVDPVLYGDTKTRLFIHFQIGNTQGFNTMLPVFVQINKDVPLDYSFEKRISQRGGTTWELPMYIYKDIATKNWWVLLDSQYDQIGFWPGILFTELAGFATNVEWGGVVYNPPGVLEPPMGSSYFPIGNSSFDGYCRSITVSHEEGYSPVNINEVIWHTDDVFSYKVFFKKLEGSDNSTYAFYGGPGSGAGV